MKQSKIKNSWRKEHCPPELVLSIDRPAASCISGEWRIRYSPMIEELVTSVEQTDWADVMSFHEQSHSRLVNEVLHAGGTKWLIVLKTPRTKSDLEQEFNTLVRQWRKETRHVSSVHEKSMNRAYQKIIRKGKDFVPFILNDLERTHDHWLWALDIIEDENPAEQAETFEEAINAWLQWGRTHGHLKK